ncbi:MAG: Maf family protein [Nitrospira sp.]|nr:septum formation protein Maf [Candidatus Manganitrophaceae bacterium]HIL35587.1 septum formation protein Maf [Candidatus Manganitrophaceae bacterium]
MRAGPRIVLASTSIRRKEILALLGIPFKSVDPDFEEHWNPAYSAKEDAISFATGKAESVKPAFPDSIVIGSDTLIEDANGKIGKPSGPEDAKKILHRLQGGQHHIWTAISLIDTRDQTTEISVERIDIQMCRIDQDEIDHYVATEEALDKAGAYSIQGKGRQFIQRLQGDYLAAVGLPLRSIADFLRHRDIPFTLDIEGLYREKSFLNWKEFS